MSDNTLPFGSLLTPVSITPTAAAPAEPVPEAAPIHVAEPVVEEAKVLDFPVEPDLAAVMQQAKALPSGATENESRHARLEELVGYGLEQDLEGLKARTVAAIHDCLVVQFSSGHHRLTTKLNPEELGLAGPQFRDILKQKRIKLGAKSFMPEELGKTLTQGPSTVRQWLTKNTIFMGRGRYLLRASIYGEFKEIFAAAKEDFYAAVAELSNQETLDNIRVAAQEHFTPLAHKAWEVLRGDHEEEGAPAGSFIDVVEPSAYFMTDYMENLLCQIPTSTEVIDKAKFEADLSVMWTPDAEILAKFAGSSAAAQTDLSKSLAKRAKNMVNEFLMAFRSQVVGSLTKSCENVRSLLEGKIKAGKKVNGKSLNGMLRVIENLQGLNPMNDEEIGKLLSTMEKYVKGCYEKDQDNAAELYQQLGDVCNQAQALLLNNLNDTEETFGNQGDGLAI